MRAATYMREHTALSTSSQASRQMCQGWSPLLGYFCMQQGAFQCCCLCKVSGEVRGRAGGGKGQSKGFFVNICNLVLPEDRSYPGGPGWGGGFQRGLGILCSSRFAASWTPASELLPSTTFWVPGASWIAAAITLLSEDSASSPVTQSLTDICPVSSICLALY